MSPDITTRPIALIGLMGVGKTTVGRRLAKKLGREFYDSDEEIEQASGRSVAGYFRDHGEPEFRAGERRVIERLLTGEPIILATGGGAFIQKDTRKILKERALTVWLKGDLDTLMARVSLNNDRPLLQVEDPRAKLAELMTARHPIYGHADITVNIAKGPHIRTVSKIIRKIKAFEKAAQKADNDIEQEDIKA